MNAPLTLLSSIVEHRTKRPGGAQVVEFHPVGEPHAKALVEAVTGHYHRITGRPRPSLAMLRDLTIAYTAATPTADRSSKPARAP